MRLFLWLGRRTEEPSRGSSSRIWSKRKVMPIPYHHDRNRRDFKVTWDWLVHQESVNMPWSKEILTTTSFVCSLVVQAAYFCSAANKQKPTNRVKLYLYHLSRLALLFLQYQSVCCSRWDLVCTFWLFILETLLHSPSPKSARPSKFFLVTHKV